MVCYYEGYIMQEKGRIVHGRSLEDYPISPILLFRVYLSESHFGYGYILSEISREFKRGNILVWA